MGNSRSKVYEPTGGDKQGNRNKLGGKPPKFHAFRDKYETLEQVQEGLKVAGLESSSLILGVDYTISNKDAGKHTFFGRSLHSISPDIQNPYQQVISIIGRTLEIFDDDKLIPAYGFGDKTTQEKAVFPFYTNKVCQGFQEVLSRYNEITPNVTLAGPTSFAPIIKEAVRLVKQEKGYHILLIAADGQVTPDSDYSQSETETRNAIVEASEYPLSIIVVGVGDGPWQMMEEFDDQLPDRKFDNFQFVDFAKSIGHGEAKEQEVNFALAALQEIPDQYQAIKQFGLLDRL